MSVDNRSDEQLAAMGERLTRARLFPSGTLKAQRYGDLQTNTTIDLNRPPMPAEVAAQLQEMEESIQRRVDVALAEYRAEREKQLNETVKQCVWTVCWVGVLCVITLVISEVAK